MAKLRKWVAYRKVERPYTRYSTQKKKAFVKARPGKKVIKFDMGNLEQKDYGFKVSLISKELVQVRANAIEAGRITTLKKLETALGTKNFYFKILMVPHHIIRENPLAAGAGADRLSTGMKHSFGKTIGTACQIRPDKVVAFISLPKEREDVARDALAAYSRKLPFKTTIQ